MGAIRVVNNSNRLIYVSVPMQHKDSDGGFWEIKPQHDQSWSRLYTTVCIVLADPVAKKQPKMFGIPTDGTIVIEDEDLEGL